MWGKDDVENDEYKFYIDSLQENQNKFIELKITEVIKLGED